MVFNRWRPLRVSRIPRFTSVETGQIEAFGGSRIEGTKPLEGESEDIDNRRTRGDGCKSALREVSDGIEVPPPEFEFVLELAPLVELSCAGSIH